MSSNCNTGNYFLGFDSSWFVSGIRVPRRGDTVDGPGVQRGVLPAPHTHAHHRLHRAHALQAHGDEGQVSSIPLVEKDTCERSFKCPEFTIV